MKKSYKLLIKLLGNIEYQGTITKRNGNNSEIDNDNYEKMLKELLIEKDDIKIKKCPKHKYDFCLKQKNLTN